jgi:hypothetical protein
MTVKRKENRQINIENSTANFNSDNYLKIVAAIAGIILAFLTGSFIFYEVGKGSMSNECEGDKILLSKQIDSLTHLNSAIQLNYLLAKGSIENCTSKYDSVINEIYRLKNQITESKYLNNIKVASLIRQGKILLENSVPIQAWKDECIVFLENNYAKEVADFKSKTNYTLSSVGQRKQAIENGINLLKSLN